MVMDYSPWHPDKSYVESFKAIMARDAGWHPVVTDSIPISSHGYVTPNNGAVSHQQNTGQDTDVIPEVSDLSMDFSDLLTSIV
jgi:hypothetical protein